MAENEVKEKDMMNGKLTEANATNQDNDFKYYMQDTSKIYIGARHTYAELMEHEMVPFKLKSIFEHYIMKDTQPDTSLESQFYYMTDDQFSYRTYMQLKAKVKVCILVEKNSLFGKKKIIYQDQMIPLKEFVQMNLAQKKKYGVKIQEISISKLAMMSFSV
ncbi:MAG: hypothetical protein J6B68_04710 [Lachnospiraceae bacterium]|nr:hypothetical protein [Lachnospiraceae bacterium]